MVLFHERSACDHELGIIFNVKSSSLAILTNTFAVDVLERVFICSYHMHCCVLIFFFEFLPNESK